MFSSAVLEESYFGRPVRTHVREFAGLLTIILFGITAYLLAVSAPLRIPVILVSSGAVLLVLGYWLAQVLYPFWRLWMHLAELLGRVVTFVILGVCWIGMFIPIGLGLKLFGIRVMDTTFKSDRLSYWDERDPAHSDYKLLERQF